MKLTVLAFALAGLFAGDAAARATDAALTETSLYNLDETWVRQDGAPLELGALSGKFVIAAMGYTTCKDLCPATVIDMMWIDRHLPDDLRSRVEFVFFSFDSEADTPERMGLYAEGHGLDLGHWALFGSQPDNVRELAAALSIGYLPNSAGAFTHQSVITLLDPKGDIVMQQRGVQADSRELLDRLSTLASH